MIISASRRTDIPAFFSEWFFRRLAEGHVLVRQPANPHRVSRVSLSPDVVDGIVFWTKNPAPMLEKLPLLGRYAYYFQFTLNAYGRDVETAVPSKRDVIIPAFRRLSSLIGRERVIWRYDPVFLSERYTVEHHLRYFDRLAGLLAPWTEKCIISFLDVYRNTKRNMAPLGLREMTPDLREELAGHLAGMARSRGLVPEACAENMDFSRFGMGRARCVDAGLLGRIRHDTLKTEKDRNQRPACGCARSIDIGAYDCCLHGCRYCYACTDGMSASKGAGGHDPYSALLVGHPGSDDVITELAACSCADRQFSLC